MRHLILIAFLGIIAFTSCDGRTTKNDSLKKSVSQFRDSIKPIEIVEYLPKEYSEIQTDTILSNGLKISIKTYTDMYESVVEEKRKDTVSIVKHVHRKWVSEVKVEKEGKLVFNKTIDDSFFNKHMGIDFIHLSNSINLETTITTTSFENANDYVVIDTGLIFPKEEKHFFYSIKIDITGKYSITKSSKIEETI